MTEERSTVPASAVWTIPNVISMTRIALIGVFLWLLVSGHDVWAFATLVAAAISDYLDGFLARRWGQVTKLGRLLDPAADRLLTVAVVVGLAMREVIPWWLVAIVLIRDAVVGLALLVAKRRGLESPQVSLVGKAATFGLYLALPLAYIAYGRWDGVHLVAIIGAVVAAVLYWISGLGYVRDIHQRSDRPGRTTANERA